MIRLRERLTDLPVRRRTPRNLCAEARSVMSDVAGSDDVTMLAMIATRDTARRAKLDLPADPRAAGMSRRFLRRTMQGWGADADTMETAELCVSELVTNAVMHGGTSATVCAELDNDLVTIVVEDRGGRGAIQHSPQDAMMMVSGRGLTLVDALTAAWGAEQVGDSTTVWFELELHSVATSEPAS
jgi:anti-sigma regulatory factor (Ser/Thr protein kinase)